MTTLETQNDLRSGQNQQTDSCRSLMIFKDQPWNLNNNIYNLMKEFFTIKASFKIIGVGNNLVTTGFFHENYELYAFSDELPLKYWFPLHHWLSIGMHIVVRRATVHAIALWRHPHTEGWGCLNMLVKGA